MRVCFPVLLALCACARDGREDVDPSVPWLEPPQTQEPVSGVEGILSSSGVVACEDPSERSRLGALYEPDLGEAWKEQHPPGIRSEEPFPSGGVAVADFTGDGLLDFFLPADTPCMLFVGQADGTVADESDRRIPFAERHCRAWGAAAGDYDGDGDLDLYLPRERFPDVLWENDGTGLFTDVTDAAGIPETWCGSRSASWGDMDGDGDLDLFVARHRVILEEIAGECVRPEAPESWSMESGGANTLLRNRGDGTFEDVSDRLPFHGLYAYSFVGGWYDLDRDHDLDLYLINDFSPHTTDSTAWMNDGAGFFRELPASAGLQLPGFAMSLSAADLNADGHPDFVVSDIDRLHLLESLGRLEWVNRATARGLLPDPERVQAAAWGVALEDVNNDTRVDVAAVYGPTEDPLAEGIEATIRQPDALFVQQPDGSFLDEGLEWGFDDLAVGRGMVVADLDGNGWVDFVRPNYRTGPTRVTYQRCGEEAWATVSLDGPHSGYGARVELEADGLLQVRWMDPTNESLGSTGPAQVHFGLGEATRIDVVRVFWPDGTITTNRDIPPRQHLVIGQP